MLHRTSTGCCEQDIGMTRAKTPHYCEHGGLLVYVHGLTRSSSPSKSKPRRAMKRSQPKRDWTDARRKVEDEGACRVCGSNEHLQAAHIIGRQADQLKPGLASGPLWVNPDSIVPLCGDFSRMKCHSTYDGHRLDILEFLTAAEQVQAVKDAGGIESARRRTAPSLYKILPERESGEVAA